MSKRRACPVGPKMMKLSAVRKFEKQAAEQGVSKVARSDRGFLTAYKRGDLDEWWCRRRAAFVKRHMAQVRKRKEPLFDKDGKPTRRHLALIMWAYSPSRRVW